MVVIDFSVGIIFNFYVCYVFMGVVVVDDYISVLIYVNISIRSIVGFIVFNEYILVWDWVKFVIVVGFVSFVLLGCFDIVDGNIVVVL